MVSRRLLLTCGGTTLAASIAGCSNILGEEDDANGRNNTDDGNSTANGNQTANPDEANRGENGGDISVPAYTDWLAADIVGENWTTYAVKPATVATFDGVEGLGLAPDFESLGDPDIDQVVTLGREDEERSFAALVGRFERQTAVSFFEHQADGNEPVHTDSYQGYELYRFPATANHSLRGVQDGVIVSASDRETLELGIDAKNGQVPRLHAVDQRLERLVTAMTVRHALEFSAAEYLGGVAIASGYDYAEDESEFELVVDHTSREGASSLTEFMEDESKNLELTEPAVTFEGELVTLTATTPSDALEPVSPGWKLLEGVKAEVGYNNPGGMPPQVPEATFENDYYEDNRLIITHVAGDHFMAGQVTIEGTGSPNIGLTWAELSTDDAVTAESYVGAGDSLRLEDVDPDYELELVWRNEDGDMSVVIGDLQGHEA